MDNKLKEDLLKSIELSGSVSLETANVKVIINAQLHNVVDLSSGKKRIRPLKVGQFKFILSQPLSLSTINPFEIRCLNCGRIITYPAWWLELKFDRNILEYFVCFSEISPSRVSLDCSGKR